MQPDLRRRHPIREMGVFGSYVHGRQTETSDVDVLVEPGEGIGLLELAGLQQDLSDALGVKVDLPPSISHFGSAFVRCCAVSVRRTEVVGNPGWRRRVHAGCTNSNMMAIAFMRGPHGRRLRAGLLYLWIYVSTGDAA